MPEGDTLHGLARRIAPMIGERVLSLNLPMSTQNTKHLIGYQVQNIQAHGKNLLVVFEKDWMLRVH
ncbi:MAG: Fpg/Nei family DNA glycosylase, partial [Deltaproteobacteria bacterium]|nr:Fpg/Nei family DNA glycosylase [Deltaproteobacteria bacterium]